MGWEGVHRACRQTASVRTTKGLADRVVVGRHLGGGWPVQAPLRKEAEGTPLVVQWLRLHAPNAEGPGWIPGTTGNQIPHASLKIEESTSHN